MLWWRKMEELGSFRGRRKHFSKVGTAKASWTLALSLAEWSEMGVGENVNKHTETQGLSRALKALSAPRSAKRAITRPGPECQAKESKFYLLVGSHGGLRVLNDMSCASGKLIWQVCVRLIRGTRDSRQGEQQEVNSNSPGKRKLYLPWDNGPGIREKG